MSKDAALTAIDWAIAHTKKTETSLPAARTLVLALAGAKTYIEETAAELERVRAGFDAMAADYAMASSCPRDEEFNAAEAIAFGCPVDAEGELDTYDCQRNSADCWQKLFIQRGNAK
jgi:hypothetical protein